MLIFPVQPSIAQNLAKSVKSLGVILAPRTAGGGTDTAPRIDRVLGLIRGQPNHPSLRVRARYLASTSGIERNANGPEYVLIIYENAWFTHLLQK